MKTKTIMLFVALLILLVGVASASEVSDDTNGISDTSDVSGDMISTGSSPVVSEDTTVMPQIAAKNATSKKENAEAFLLAGTKVTIKETRLLESGNLWAKIPSGYICIWEEDIDKKYIY